MEKYSSYKDSGFAWMGQIPSHWETRRFRFLLAENSLQNTDLKERNQLQFKYGDIVPKANQSEDKDVLDTIKKYTVVAPGDIMINGLNLNYDFISQRVAQVQEPGVITSAYVSLRPLEGANSKYYTYYMKAMDAQKMFHGMGSGVRLTLSYDNLKNLFFPYPSPEEQNAIVAYLDAATAKIDEAIAQQQRMIDLLNERRQIIICRIITKGLDAKAKMKDSGIEWVGDVPDSWEKRRIYYTIDRRFDGAWGDDEKGNSDDVICYRIADFDYQKGYLDDKKFTLRNVDPETRKKKQVQKGDLLVEKSGGGDLYPVGRVVSVNYEQDAICSNFIQALKIKDGFDSRFIFYVFKAMYSKKVNIPFFNQTTGIQNLQVKEYLKNEMFYPSYEDQCKISGFLDSISNSIQDGIEDCNRMITLLQERKQIIINDVVTGKVRIV